MGRLFGTDGVRGVANGDLTPELALGLAAAAVRELLAHRSGGGSRPQVCVGRDPRPSGELLEAAVVAGLAAAGADVVSLGIVPTAVVAHATAAGADLGVMITASHNPLPDNGIKFFAAGGWKLPDETEDAIEARLTETWSRPTGRDVGRVRRDRNGPLEAYVSDLVATAPVRLDGLKVVVDAANGAASWLAPRVYESLGAEVIALHTGEGDINDGVGATHPEVLQAAVVSHGAAVGIAHDGDADRCLAVDASGALVDGDQILALCALALRERGRLKGDTVVATVMANLGFHHAMRDAGINVLTTPVGDRYVLEELQRSGLVLGGEQSGHVVFLDEATTGDGLRTAVHVLARMAETGRSLADLSAVVQRLPQVLVGCKVSDPRAVAASPQVLVAVAEAEAKLGDNGRVLVRASGTEPLVRVMVEAPTALEAEQVTQVLCAAVASVQ